MPYHVQIHILDRIPIGRQSAAAATIDHHESTAENDPSRAEHGYSHTRRKGCRPRPRKKSSGSRYDYDEHATVYISPESDVWSMPHERRGNAAAPGSAGEPFEDNVVDGAACLLFRRTDADGRDGMSMPADDDDDDDDVGGWMREGRRLLWAPVIVRSLPRDHEFGPSDDENVPELYIPPCLAATLGLHGFHRTHRALSTLAYLQPLSARNIVRASHATLREIGIPPPVPDLKWPSSIKKLEKVDDGSKDKDGLLTKNSNNDGTPSATNRKKESMECGEDEEQLRKFFLRAPKRHQDRDHEQQHVHPNFRTGKGPPRRSKPRQRLLALGSIFATTPSSLDRCDDGDLAVPNGVRFYQVVDIHFDKSTTSWDGRAYIVSPSTQLVLLPAATTINSRVPQDNKIMSLHPQLEDVPMMNGYAWRLPRPSLALSFLRSIENNIVSDSLKMATADSNYTADGDIHHPSSKDLVDAIYLQGVVPSARPRTKGCRSCRTLSSHAETSKSSAPSATNDGGPRIIHVVAKEENHARACVDEAADIMGMRSFHVDGLAAFWAHYNLFRTYSGRPQHPPSSNDSHAKAPPLTGALPDKLRGLSAALEIAHRSSPCVLHIVGIDRELSSAKGPAADPDARKEEEGRMLETIREGGVGPLSSGPRLRSSTSMLADDMHFNAPATTATGGRIAQDPFLSNSTSPHIIIVLSTSNPLPPGPISSSLLQSSIAVSAPDVDYARILWDKDVDGTFEALSSSLVGLSARDIRYLREKFAPRWKEVEMADNAKNSMDGASTGDDTEQSSKKPSPVDVLQSLLPHLDSTHAFAQSSRKGGGSGTALPLSSSSLPNVRWEDIGGLESVRREIMDAVELPLKHPALFEGSRRSGILLFGPPGTGKTLVAKAVARECGLPFLSIKGPELLGSYVGESEANVRAAFEAARSAATDPPRAPSANAGEGGGSGGGYGGASVLFFDELDSLAPRRGDTGHGDGVMDRVVATLLGELDDGGGRGGDSPAHVVVIGATNRPDLLDPSLLRPGRFDRLLYLGPAKTREHCLQILRAQTRKFRFEQEEERGDAAKMVLERAMESFPPTLSGADLSAVASGALMRGLKRVCDRIEEESRRPIDTSDEGAANDGICEISAVDIDDVMESWRDEDLQPTMTVEDFVEAANEIVPSISKRDLENFERLQVQFSSGQYS